MTQQLHSWAFIPEKQKLTCTQNLSMNVYSSFICNSPKLETAQMFFNGWMVNKTVVYSYHGILLSNKKKQTIDTHNSLDESPENDEWKKANPWFLLAKFILSASSSSSLL